MADTIGLLKTRGEWTDAVTNGETTLTHAEWYKKKKLEEQVKGQQEDSLKGQQEDRPSLASLAIK